MLEYLTLILICQLVGEISINLLELPIPGPVVGMIFLFLYLLAKGAVPSALSNVSSTLLTNMSVLFIPAGVGVMAHTTLLKTDFWPIMIAMVVSTLVTIIVTALVMKKLNKTSQPDGAPQPND